MARKADDFPEFVGEESWEDDLLSPREPRLPDEPLSPDRFRANLRLTTDRLINLGNSE